VYWFSVNWDFASSEQDTMLHMPCPFLGHQEEALEIGRLSPAGACFARFSQLAFQRSKDDYFASLQPVLGSYVADGAVQPFRIIDLYEFSHNVLRILQRQRRCGASTLTLE